ncbi:MAG: OmpH family outer membrane protein [Cytophagales bacterium]|nr:OmpH family outer membrane protein [Cytophagales bacterium]
MKSRILLLATIAVMSIISVKAQGLKVGYADANYILALMPEAQQAQADIASHESMIRTNLEAKYKDYQTKLASYQENVASFSELDRTDKERELVAIQESIQKYEGEAQNSVTKKQNDLLQPLFQKIGKAIESVAIENNYDFIFSAGAQGVDILLYAKKDKNMTNLVLAKLGIDPPADQ